jgi:hypothetical protein
MDSAFSSGLRISVTNKGDDPKRSNTRMTKVSNEREQLNVFIIDEPSMSIDGSFSCVPPQQATMKTTTVRTFDNQLIFIPPPIEMNCPKQFTRIIVSVKK